MLADERLSAAFKRWDRNRSLLHAKRKELGAATAAFRRGEGPEPALLSIEVECLDELCSQLFAQLLAIADEVDASREQWLALYPQQRR